MESERERERKKGNGEESCVFLTLVVDAVLANYTCMCCVLENSLLASVDERARQDQYTNVCLV